VTFGSPSTRTFLPNVAPGTRPSWRRVVSRAADRWFTAAHDKTFRFNGVARIRSAVSSATFRESLAVFVLPLDDNHDT